MQKQLYKQEWLSLTETAIQRFKQNLNGLENSRLLAQDTDSFITKIYNDAKQRYPDIDLSIVATGGYGHTLRVPYSDIDIVFLCDDIPTATPLIETILYALWDTGAKIGQTIHTIDTFKSECQDHIVTLTSLLSMRSICGDTALANTVIRYIDSAVIPFKKYEFVREKKQERINRHKHFGVSRYLLEPNIKEGKGGLRDLQTLYWVCHYTYGLSTSEQLCINNKITAQEKDILHSAQEFLWAVRFALHCSRGKADEVLTFNSQIDVSTILGYNDNSAQKAVEQFMQHYFKIARTVGTLTRSIFARIDSLYTQTDTQKPTYKDSDFYIKNGQVYLYDISVLQNNPKKIISLFQVLENRNASLSPETFAIVLNAVHKIDDNVRNDDYIKKQFIDIVAGKTAPEKALRTMNETGVLEAILPEWGGIMCQMQYNMYHSYTTDEHTIRAIGFLHRIEKGELKAENPLSTAIFKTIQNRRILYIATLLHDIAKGRDGDHSIEGAKMAFEICPRLGFNTEETEIIADLIRYHLMISNTSQRRDINDIKTIEDFTSVICSLNILDMLTVLTVADVRAVGENVWNSWKADTIRHLYHAAKAHLVKDTSYRQTEPILESIKTELGKTPELLNEKWDIFLKNATPEYLLGSPLPDLLWQIRFILKINTTGIHIKPIDNKTTQILAVLPDRKNLAADLAGVFTILNLDVLQAKLCTITGLGAINTFIVQHGEYDTLTADKILDTLQKHQQKHITLEDKIARKQQQTLMQHTAFSVVGQVYINNTASHTHSVIEVRAKNRIGLLYSITKALSQCGMHVYSAKISTYGERVMDVFYVKDLYGFKIHRKQAQNIVKKTILQVLNS